MPSDNCKPAVEPVEPVEPEPVVDDCMETTWVNIPGGLTDIGAGADGSVWGVNSNDDIY